MMVCETFSEQRRGRTEGLQSMLRAAQPQNTSTLCHASNAREALTLLSIPAPGNNTWDKTSRSTHVACFPLEIKAYFCFHFVPTIYTSVSHIPPGATQVTLPPTVILREGGRRPQSSCLSRTYKFPNSERRMLAGRRRDEV
ncbi:hypothetical protein E2C01_002647 [Portunus trituberculatus]|uniref:Uncharacterized protein n=1 Tax=Portunus trituberculatus TaxID=210409 RepID=A0A5B7CJX0_PORTR|nr:hypothetical protein [Portunus trituberculatus]